MMDMLAPLAHRANYFLLFNSECLVNNAGGNARDKAIDEQAYTG